MTRRKAYGRGAVAIVNIGVAASKPAARNGWRQASAGSSRRQKMEASVVSHQGQLKRRGAPENEERAKHNGDIISDIAVLNPPA